MSTHNEKNNAKQVISLILPTYNEEGNLPVFYKDLCEAIASAKEYEFELVFIDDHSDDDTANILENLRNSDNRVAIIRLARNCGSHAAVAAGLFFCRGDAAIIIAVDLQDPPGVVIPKMIEQWKMGYKVIWGVRGKRKYESGFFSWVYYLMLKILTDARYPLSGVGAIFVDRIVIEAVNHSPEKNSSISMLIAWLGFSQTKIEYARNERFSGRSHWTLTKKIKLTLDSLISFSYIPMRFMSLTGMVCFISGIIYALHIIISKFANNISVMGWPSLMTAILLIGGVQMVMLGVLGEYLWRTYDESRARPRYVIEKNTIIN